MSTVMKMKHLMRNHIDDRLKQHRDNLAMWSNGFLDPTEPDENERNAVMRELEAAIAELELMDEFLNGRSHQTQ